jgi:hypothetical protein
MAEYFYIAGRDTAVRRSGRVVIQDVFDGPHPDETEAHSVAASMIASGDYKVISSPYRDRERARQTYSHDLALSTDGGRPVGAAAAVQSKFKLRTEKQSTKDERKSAWE